MAIVSLPVGGTITRIACGSTIRRIAWPRLMPSACGRLALSGVDREDAGPGDLGHVRRLGEPEPDDAADEPGEDLRWRRG